MKKPTIEVVLKLLNLAKDDVYNVASIRRSVSDKYIYEETYTEISVMKDGAISFHDKEAENHIYFYPDQLKHLSALVKKAEAIVKAKAKRKPTA